MMQSTVDTFMGWEHHMWMEGKHTVGQLPTIIPIHPDAGYCTLLHAAFNSTGCKCAF